MAWALTDKLVKAAQAVFEPVWRETQGDNGWVSSGFVRSTNLVGQRFVVQVLRFGDRQTVERHAVENGQLTLDIDTSADRRPPLLAVTGFAVRTTQPTNFTLSAEARQ